MARGDGDAVADARRQGEACRVRGEAELVGVERGRLPAGSGGEDLRDGDLEGRGLRGGGVSASRERIAACVRDLHFFSTLDGSFQERGASRGPQSVDSSPVGRVVTSTFFFEGARINIDAAAHKASSQHCMDFAKCVCRGTHRFRLMSICSRSVGMNRPQAYYRKGTKTAGR